MNLIMKICHNSFTHVLVQVFCSAGVLQCRCFAVQVFCSAGVLLSIEVVGEAVQVFC